ncbi:CPBP family intramembrane glutamic endopeptidase [Arcticibacter eurypsychrophilus]|uniref:CPBP family intramembrane glutamic endopeptidase n=1 Tax=Arcticibacter eurypsychrophilus TaxID=1434752 RepID=UPI0009F4187A
MILSGLIKRYSPVVGIIFSSLLFAVFHPFILGPFLFGLFMGWIYFRSRNLLYCIIVHAAVNGTGFLMRIFLFNKNNSLDVVGN